jgi:inhibitor of KinA
VVGLHTGAEYLVHAIGFTPGFPYLGGLPEALRAPRRDTPRANVPAGSVAIGGSQTGVYPVESPGGWQLIGRTPVALFRPAETPAALLRPGDRVRFRAISPEEFSSWT